ncbi:methyltransferase-like protein 22 isoform X2 [Anthonomus grandis grandis]|uniref:methyltransferase-like protein 22 isoform X2 n=1 Tax=Anthonomus grandis grandis TaxID=2921223 RepID=UPI0021669DFB|nr:methyltransferase-like protein 22 isoform X2 [Anthonomus grandis grandis]
MCSGAYLKMDIQVMDDEEIYEISSELYEEYDYTSKSKPQVNPKNVVSRFSFKVPSHTVTDEDGDLIVPRRQHSEQERLIEIEHSYSTGLNLVGLQIWRGALLLADWLIHHGVNLSKNETVLELGSGVGFTSIIGSMFCPVVCTDIDRGDIFKIIKANINRNQTISNHPVDVTELDFMAEDLPDKIKTVLPSVETVIAADVVYDDHLTDAFLNTVRKLLNFPGKRRVFVALEKRYVFTISECDGCAPCFDYFLENLMTMRNVKVQEETLDFPQFFTYDRCKELVLLKIEAV